MPALTERAQPCSLGPPGALQAPNSFVDTSSAVGFFFYGHGKLELTGAPGPETNGGSDSRKHRGSWRQLAISIKCFRLQHL